jgi:hypothetical protein
MLPVWSLINCSMPSPVWTVVRVVPSAPVMRPLRGISASSSARVVADGLVQRAPTRTKPSPTTSIFGKVEVKVVERDLGDVGTVDDDRDRDRGVPLPQRSSLSAGRIGLDA